MRRGSGRRLRLRREQFGPQAEFLRDERCATCGADPPSEPSHVSSRGAGGKADSQIPQCWRCHRELHRVGIRTFERDRAISLTRVAAEYVGRWTRLGPGRRERYELLFRIRETLMLHRPGAVPETLWPVWRLNNGELAEVLASLSQAGEP